MDDSDDLPFVLAGRVQRRKRRSRPAFVGTGPGRSTAAPSAVQRSPTQHAGDASEDRALALLTAHGLRLLARNLTCAMGEIDLVMRDGATLVFVEVRARRRSAYGGAAASVSAAKQQRLVRAAQFFLPKLARVHFSGVEPACRFDIVAFDGGEPVWLRGAMDNAVPSK